MKKSIYYISILLIPFMIFSCEKKGDNCTTPNLNEINQFKSIGGGFSIQVTFRAGHNGPDPQCLVPYLGDIMVTQGNYKHIPCVGKGTNCEWTIGLNIQSTYSSAEYNTTYATIVTLSDDEARSESQLVMPARSLLMQDSTSATSIGVSESDIGIWINLPEQTWERIDSTHYSLSYGIEFDSIPDYL